MVGVQTGIGLSTGFQGNRDCWLVALSPRLGAGVVDQRDMSSTSTGACSLKLKLF
jgi:hypothetical protein